MTLLCSLLAAVTLAVNDLPQGSKLLHGSCADPDGQYTYLVHTIGRNALPVTQVERGWCHDAAMSVFETKTGRYVNTVLLDDLDLGAAEPWDVLCTEKEIVVAHSGTSELSYIDRRAFLAKFEAAKGRDLSIDLSFMQGIRRRVKTPKRGPRKLKLADGKVVVTEYLADKPGVTKGELLFNDARECFQSWQSCATCHPGGRSDNMTWSFPTRQGLGAPEVSCDLVTRRIRLEALFGMVMSDLTVDLFATPDEAKAKEIEKYIRSLNVHNGAASAGSHLVTGSDRFYVLDAGGTIRSEVKGCGNIHRVWRSGDWVYYSNGSLWRVRADGRDRQCVYRAEKGEACFGFEILPDGGLVIADNAADRVLEFAAPGASTTLPLDAAKACVAFKVNVADAAGCVANAHVHLRMVRKTLQGTYLVGTCVAGFIREYDRTGKLVWEQEAKPLAFEAIRLANGNTLVSHLKAITEYAPDHRVVRSFTSAAAPELKLDNFCGLAWDEGRLVVGTYANGAKDGSRTTAFALDWATGKVLWHHESKADRSMMTVWPVQRGAHL